VNKNSQIVVDLPKS